MKNRETINSTIEDIFYLASCALNNQAPDIQRISEMDSNLVFTGAAFHSVEALTYYAFKLCDLGISLKDRATGADMAIMHKAFGISEELLAKWNEAYKRSTIKNVQLDSGRRELFEAMEEQGCWHLPLKGVILKDMYPAAGMRQMSDNDILFDESFRPWVKEWFESQGYKTEIYDTSYDDVFFKPPYRLYEMHVSLVGNDDKLWWPYYKDIKDRLVKVDGTNCEYAFTDEDYYIYMMVHAYKHYRGGGTGIRIFFDTYVYLNNKKECLDWDYIYRECGRLQIEEFEKSIRKLSMKVIGNKGPWIDVLSESEQKIMYYIIGSGTYGTVNNRIKNGVEDSSGGKVTIIGKIKFLFTRIFLPKEVMYMHHPLCRKHHWLLPFYYLKRIIKGLFQKRIYDEVGRVVKMKSEEANNINE